MAVDGSLDVGLLHRPWQAGFVESWTTEGLAACEVEPLEGSWTLELRPGPDSAVATVVQLVSYGTNACDGCAEALLDGSSIGQFCPPW